MTGKFHQRVSVIDDYWEGVYGKTPTASTFVILTVLLLAVVYALGSLYMIPSSLVRSFMVKPK